ncbi:MAG: hypothetical protein QOK15_535 [Nocardioidaceae bacterium]|nr:hypothetical protein [Nocardioidaceae bacterium]
MISFRYHIVSIVAVFLALAVGIVLGSGPLHAEDLAGTSGGTSTAADQARTRSLQTSLGFADAYGRATAAQVVAHRLDGRAVTLVTLPGADPKAAAAVADLVAKAGGSVTARVALGEKLLDVANRQLVTELATQMRGTAKGVLVPAAGTGYQQLGALVAHAVVTRVPAGEVQDEAGKSVLAGVQTAGLVSTTGTLARRGSLAVVVAGAPRGSADQRTGAGTILSSFLVAMDARSAGTVLAGPITSGADDGLVGEIRHDRSASAVVSTVDVVDRPAGAAVAVLALAGQLAGGSGQYGTPGSPDGAAPVLTASPAASNP